MFLSPSISSTSSWSGPKIPSNTPPRIPYHNATAVLSTLSLSIIHRKSSTAVISYGGAIEDDIYYPPVDLLTDIGFSAIVTAHPVMKPNSAFAPPTIQQTAAAQTPVAEAKPTYSMEDSPPLEAPSETISRLPASVTIEQNMYIANSVGAFVINSQTLTAGGTITSSDHVLSMATDGHALVVDSSTINLEPAYVVGTQTLIPGGPAITVGDTVMSLESGNGGRKEILVIGVSMTEGVGGPAGVATGGSVTTLESGSKVVGEEKSSVIEVSVTLDMSMLITATSRSGEATLSVAGGETTTGVRATTSIRATTGVRAPGKTSSSKKLSVSWFFMWQIVQSAIIISAFV